MTAGAEEIRYKRSRFSARLPVDRLYSPSHFWVQQQDDGTWRVGFTRFARRMLGEMVEVDFEMKPGDDVKLGDIVGWVEAFKAVTDLYCVGAGQFLGGNPRLAHEIGLIDEDPHAEGWLYAFKGEPDGECVDAEGYTRILDAQIDKMIGEEEAKAQEESET